MTDQRLHDLAVIGGGINGAGIVADAAGRGIDVVLIEQGDLGGATSSASSKLIHGGLRYLEHYEFRLVSEALAEREVLLRKAPHIVWPLRFLLPHVEGMRSPHLIRLGLWLYDHLGRRERLPASRAVDLAADPAGRALAPGYRAGFSYYDCWVDDARLVILNCRAARDRGADIRPRSAVVGMARADGHWRLKLQGPRGAEEIAARVVVNAAGPWADRVRAMAAMDDDAEQPGATGGAGLRLVKGSHIVVPRITDQDTAFILQAPDRRIVFLLPYERDFTLIGTTEVEHATGLDRITASPAEELYLLDVANRFLARQIGRRDIVWSFAGVRPLFGADGGAASAVSRDWQLDLHKPDGHPPLLTVYGGKVTTYRKLAEAALLQLGEFLPAVRRGPWTASEPLPGGDLGGRSYDDWLADLVRRHPALPADFLSALARRHGSLADIILADAREPADLGHHLGGGLTEREVAYLREQEWAEAPDDFLWRRTKCGLHMSAAERRAAIAWLSGNRDQTLQAARAAYR